VSLKLAEQKPLFGWGYGSFDRIKFGVKLDHPVIPLAVALQDTSHDTFLTILVEYGGVGLLLYFLPIGAIGWLAVKHVRHGDPNRWLQMTSLGAIGVTVLTAATLDFRFFSFVPMLPWLFLALSRRGLGPDDATLAAA
jgi:O-antigen ligase